MSTTGHESETITVSGLKSSLQKLKTDKIDVKADKATTLAGYGITDSYTKTEVNGLVDTPHQEYVTVENYASLPPTGSVDTIYRVKSWDGSANGGQGAVDDTVYSEYAWDDASNPAKYVFLCVKSQIGEVFDITIYNNNTKYADLAAALGTNGANIPQSLRKGGMSVKFVLSSDNKYVQCFLNAQTFTTDVSAWEKTNLAANVEQIVFTDNGELNYFLPNIWTNISGVVCIRMIYTGSYLAIALYSTTVYDAPFVAQIKILKQLSEIQDGVYSDDNSTFKVYIHDIQSLTAVRWYFGLVNNGIYNYDLQDLIKLNTLETDITLLHNDLNNINNDIIEINDDVSDIVKNLPSENSGENILVISSSLTSGAANNNDAYVILINTSDIPILFTVSKVNYRSDGATNIEIWLAGRNNVDANPTLVQNFGNYVVNSSGETVININSNKRFEKAQFDNWYIGIKHNNQPYYYFTGSEGGSETFRYRDNAWSAVNNLSFNADFYVSGVSVADMTSVLSDIEELKKAQTSLQKYDYMSMYRTTNFSDWLNWKAGTSQATDWSVSSNGAIPTAHSTFEGKLRNGVLYLNKPCQSAWKKAVFDIILYNDTVLDIHFARRQNTGGYPNESLYQIDCVNNLLKVMSLSDRDVTYNVFKSKTIGFSIVNGRKYRCEVSMEDVSFKFSLTDLVTAETTLLTFNNTWSAGTQKDIYGFGWNAGTNAPTITYFEIFEPRNPLVCFLGDSITEGYGMQSDLKNRFVSVAIRSLLNNSIACAASSNTISNVQSAISQELSIIKPKYAIITIGTNDGMSATSQQYANLKTELENIGCIPIFNHIPANNYAGHDFTYVNGQIDRADVFNGAYLDVATSIDNTPSSGVNTAMFVDGIHPNEAGTRAILRRFISDIPLLFDNDLITEYWEN